MSETIHTERLKEVAFDLYERYILLEPIGKLFRPSHSPYRVLDVGGHTPAFWPGFSSIAGALIPDASVTVVDMHPSAELSNYVRASGLQLPFRDGAFDLVCSLDTLEHVPCEQRPGLLSELLRVTQDGLYIAFPFDSASNRWAESILVDYANAVLQAPIPALLEHRQFGLPEADLVSNALLSHAYPWINFAQGNTDIWLVMMLTYHSLRIPGTDFVQELNRRFNQVYAAQDWGPPTYRTGYVLSKSRSIGDLEALRTSFVSTKPADLQGVLSFCQLFLTIAQNGRVIANKDRHIRNIERELEATKVYRDQVVTQLEEIQKQIGNLQSDIELQGRRSAQSDAANRQFLVRMSEKLATNERAVQAIYDSRIWKALSGLGGLALRLTGNAAKGQGSILGSSPNRRAVRVRTPSATGEFMALVCDYPGDNSVLAVGEVAEIRGWAVAESGIDRVLIEMASQPPAAASYGILRQDVARSHPSISDASHSGYRFFWDTSGLPEGPYRIRVIAIAKSGQQREVTCTIMVDRNSSPKYELWIARNEPTIDEKRQMRVQAGKFPVRPQISIAVPVYKTPVDVLTRCIESVVGQIYSNWDLCLADDGSGDPGISRLLQDYARRDSRIHVVALPRNRGISAATNEALKVATGEYVAFLDHDDELADFALWEVARAINAEPDVDLFYSDEDKIDEDGRRYEAFFKPGWSPDLFLSCNYICHFVVVKRSIVDRLGGLNEDFNGAQDYEFLLRVTELTQRIVRIPRVLYHWRAVYGSAARDSEDKPQACGDGRRALSSYLARMAPGATVEEVKTCRYRVRYPVAGNPRVTILMPTSGHQNLFRAALEEVLEKTSYKNYEIVLIDNSETSQVEEYASRLAARKAPVRCLNWRNRPFNFSRMNNEAVRSTGSPYILFLNDDTTIITAEWLGAMLEHAQRAEVGAVGAQLWYPDDSIQHAGVVMGLYGNCSHAFKNQAAGRTHYFDFPDLIRDCSAVTAACLLIARDKFLEAGGFDEVNLAVAFQDVDLCLKLLELGYRNIYTPYAKLYHHESATKTEDEKIPHPAEDNFMKTKWAKYIADDPYYSPNLTRHSEDFSIAVE